MTGASRLALGLALFGVAVVAVVIGNAVTAGLQLRHMEQSRGGDR